MEDEPRSSDMTGGMWGVTDEEQAEREDAATRRAAIERDHRDDLRRHRDEETHIRDRYERDDPDWHRGLH